MNHVSETPRHRDAENSFKKTLRLCVVIVTGVIMLSLRPSAQRASQVLREGGDVREILKIEPATTPMRIAIIVDDSGTGIFRVPVANFVNQLLGSAELCIKHVIAQAVRLVDYTSDVEMLRNAILRLGVRAETPDGGRVVEAIFDSARELADADRPVIVVLTDTYSAHSTLPAQHVLDELQRSGAMLHVIAVTRLAPLNPSSVPTAKDKPADLLEHQLDINRVLGDGPKQTGGRRVEIGGLGGTIPELQGVAAVLKQQYLITYLVPAGEKLNQRLNVSVKRRGVTVRAPARSARSGR